MPVTLIDQVDDPRISEYRSVSDPGLALHAGVFVAEGSFVVSRLLRESRFVTRSVLVTATALDRLSPVLPSPDSSVEIFVTSLAVMREVTGFNIHRGCLALGERPAPVDPIGLMESGGLLLVLEGLGNPDNIGGVFRNAAAFDVAGVLLGPGCADPLYRKAIRVSMAATLMVPFARVADWPADLAALGSRGVRLVALTPSEKAADLASFSTTRRPADRLALMIGSEGGGLSREALDLADVQVRIPISTRTDSLNAATAAGIALHRLAPTASRP